MLRFGYRFASASVLGFSFVLGFGLAACKRQKPATGTAASGTAAPMPSGSALPTPEEVSHCSPVANWGMTLEADAAQAPKKKGDDEDEPDDDALMPFGVDLGDAVATPDGFAVAGIRGAAQAFVALMGAGGSRRIDLGELHGDMEAPAIAAAPGRLLVALRSTDAAGFTLKLGSVGFGPEQPLAWGPDASKLGKTLTGLVLAVSGTHGALAYQGEDKTGTRILLSSFSVEGAVGAGEPKPIGPKDVEQPRLVGRAGGFWLSWVRTVAEPKRAPKPAAPTPSAGAEQEDPEERELLDVGLKVLELAKLDEQGKLMGAPLRVGEPRRQVLLYDLASLAAGGVLVAGRSDSAAPGAEGGALVLSEIAPDGTIREDRVEDDELGAGAPALLTESDPKLPSPWLAMSSLSDATRIGLARGRATTLGSDPLLGHAEVIAVSGGKLLVQRARGRSVALEALTCQLPPPPAPEPAPSEAPQPAAPQPPPSK